ncbi:amidase family protein [Croceicoccus sp. F390]|uniref:Amidase family protein n=1 Tax=Croceicoccus esteveae TaxID=3075597 RepID=A0ABU2ZIY3_9SPHN|nr:amidase family protein [Croceicoccus sp. F390]MDT0576259.1 amidase family protein [Croceicoccus sp. F390]
MPAALNRVFGSQPSAGRIPSRTPVSVHMASAGPIARDARDAALIIQVIGGRDPSAIAAPSPDLVSALDHGIDGVRIAWSPEWGAIPHTASRVIDRAHQAASLLSSAGASVDSAAITCPTRRRGGYSSE